LWPADVKLFYAKGDLADDVYLVEAGMDPDRPLVRRSVSLTEWQIASGVGTRLAVIGQSAFDAIPKIEGSP